MTVILNCTNRQRVFIQCVVCSLVFFTGCTKIQHSLDEYYYTGNPVNGDVVFIHDLSDPSGLNPYTSSDASASRIFKKVYDGLLEQDMITTELSPSIAASLPEISADHIQYTFRIRKDVVFSDGTPLTVNDIIFSFKTIKNPFIIDASSLRIYVDDVKTVEAPNDSTIIIVMKKPYFMADFQLGDLRIIPKHILDPKSLTDKYSFAETNDTSAFESNNSMKEFATWFGSSELKRNPKYLIGSGPYVIKEWLTGEKIVLERNEKLWGNTDKWRKAYPSVLVFIIINDRYAALNAIKTEQIDFFDAVSPALYNDQIDTSIAYYIRKGDYEASSYLYIGWNNKKDIFKDIRTRQALSHMCNREYWIQTLLRGKGEKVNGPIYRNRPEYDSSMSEYDYNPTKAKELLLQAGWSDSDGDGILDNTINGKKVRFEFSLMFNSGNEIRENIAILLANELKRIGIKMSPNKTEWSIMIKNSQNHEFDAYIGAWLNDNIPTDLYQLWHSTQASGGSNYVSYSNARADELMVENRTEFDVNKRTMMMRELQNIIHNDAPYTFLWTPKLLVLYNRRLSNVEFYPVRPGYAINTWFIPKSLQRYDVQ